jgi:hypothetical protein
MQALGQQVKAACIAGIFFLAGVPELVELLFKVPAGEIDTHVLMTLSCFGALAIGSALAVDPPPPPPTPRYYGAYLQLASFKYQRVKDF